MNTRELIWAIMAGVGLLSGIGLGFKAYLERRVLAANASSSNATATAVLTSAAQELLQPLRDELVRERTDHAADIEIERIKVRELRQDLEAAMAECRHLRRGLGVAHEELETLRNEMQREAEAYRKRIADLESQTG